MTHQDCRRCSLWGVLLLVLISQYMILGRVHVCLLTFPVLCVASLWKCAKLKIVSHITTTYFIGLNPVVVVAGICYCSYCSLDWVYRGYALSAWGYLPCLHPYWWPAGNDRIRAQYVCIYICIVGLWPSHVLCIYVSQPHYIYSLNYNLWGSLRYHSRCDNAGGTSWGPVGVTM